MKLFIHVQRSLATFVIALLSCSPGLALEARDDALWSLLRQGGQIVLVRHAQTTPGVGDPPGMRLDDCATQRNLSEEGRRDARLLGATLQRQGVSVRRILSSPWCRCVETARLAFERMPQVSAELGNLFDRPEREATQTQALKRLVAEVVQSDAGAPGNVFMFTHGSTISALVGVSPATSEMVILTPRQDGFSVAGRLRLR
ncbi:histidine phosphatase family protein [Hylemonella sp. W303a]|uniref:histidine phosphatase family protein n=1 Tax=Hylemonella sp. W303a TaxID=3389873 RepID=UPI00396B1185